MRIQRLCVFCGSNRGADPVFADASRDLGALLARERIALVYGGGSVGLMGELADAVLAAGGEVVGVIPHALWAREIGHRGLSELHVVDTMHERKARMAALSDAFLALPGGLGTLEEIFEIWTWAQLGLHAKPVGFLDVSGFYSKLMEFLDGAAAAQFVRVQHRAIAIVERDAEVLHRERQTRSRAAVVGRAVPMSSTGWRCFLNPVAWFAKSGYRNFARSSIGVRIASSIAMTRSAFPF